MPLTPPPSSTRSASSIARHHTDEPPQWLARNRWPPRGRQGYRVAGGSRARRPVMADIDPQRIALELDVDIDKVKALADEGLTEEQIHALLTDPMAVIEWITETT